jgi:hypothetical protein
MKREKKHTIDHITRLREIIKRKYRLLKEGDVETLTKLEKQYKPLLRELRKPDLKVESKTEPLEFKPDIFSSPNKTVQADSESEESEGPLNLKEETYYGDEVEDEMSNVSQVLNSSGGQETASRFINENFSHPLTIKYMTKLMKDLGGAKRTIDHTFGPRYENETLMVGNKTLKFDEDGSILVDDTRYKPSEGLYELLFKRIPDDQLYTDDDLNAYRNILVQTSAHKRNYNFRGNINRDGSLKYKHVVSQLFPKQLYGGKGLSTKTLSKEVPVYWDDPNELCDRLRLLVASAEAGNTGHKNEMTSIIEELKEAGIIKGYCNSRFQTLLQ